MLCSNCMKEEAVTIKDGNALCYDCYFEIYDELGLESREITIIKNKERVNINSSFKTP